MVSKPMNVAETSDPSKVTIGYLVCLRCGKKWIPRSPRVPKVCPDRECRSLRWDEPPEDKKPG